MHHVHCDYLRVFFELGCVGLICFLATFLWQGLRLLLNAQRTEGVAGQAFAAAFLGMVVFALNATTGNPLAYNVWFMNPLFALIGAAYGVAAEHRLRSLRCGAGDCFTGVPSDV
jgi:O-antigen ligase